MFEYIENSGPVRAHLLYEPGVFCTVSLTRAKSTDYDFVIDFEAGIAYCAAIALLRILNGAFAQEGHYEHIAVCHRACVRR